MGFEENISKWLRAPKQLGKSAFDLAIVRLLLLAGVIRSLQLGWVALITRALNARVSDLFSEPFFVLLPWLLAAIVTAFLAYWLGVRLMEQRQVTELGCSGAARYLTLGVIGGFVLFGAVVCSLWARGRVTYEGYAGWTGLPSTTLLFAAGVTFEELIYRGAIFRVMEESLGTTIALALSALIFGLSHLANNAATLASALSIAVTGGIAFALSYTLTRSLWLPIGLHFGWNFTQGAVFGAAVSGYPLHGAFRFTLSGPTLVTGGAFGPEASIYTTVLGIFFALGLAGLAHQRSLWAPLRLRLRLP
jgi:membrane protease YdiL (CAAX protease family)